MTNFEWMQKHHGCNKAQWQLLKKYERICHEWAEMKCNGTIQQEDGEPPHRYVIDRYGTPTVDLGPFEDEEAKAIRRASRIAAELGGLIFHQGDPRGCSLYFYTAEALAERSDPISSCYNMIGTAICGD